MASKPASEGRAGCVRPEEVAFTKSADSAFPVYSAATSTTPSWRQSSKLKNAVRVRFARVLHIRDGIVAPAPSLHCIGKDAAQKPQSARR